MWVAVASSQFFWRCVLSGSTATDVVLVNVDALEPLRCFCSVPFFVMAGVGGKVHVNVFGHE